MRVKRTPGRRPHLARWNMTDSAAVPHGEHQHCPKCNGTVVKAAMVTPPFVYLRCGRCGEVWVIPERRLLTPRPPHRDTGVDYDESRNARAE